MYRLRPQCLWRRSWYVYHWLHGSWWHSIWVALPGAGTTPSCICSLPSVLPYIFSSLSVSLTSHVSFITHYVSLYLHFSPFTLPLPVPKGSSLQPLLWAGGVSGPHRRTESESIVAHPLPRPTPSLPHPTRPLKDTTHTCCPAATCCYTDTSCSQLQNPDSRTSLIRTAFFLTRLNLNNPNTAYP